MSANARTPGPWIVGEVSGDIVSQRGAGVCSPVENFDETAWAADAPLIAAAPELLEACEQFTAAAHEVRDLLNAKGFACPASIAYAAELARHAIRKANGRI